MSEFSPRTCCKTVEPRALADPEKELAELFHDLVEGTPRADKGPDLKRFFGLEFERAGLSRKLRTDIHVTVPAFRKEVKIPYGYQNGRFNLIRPVPFRATDLDQALSTACRYAVEGESRFKHPDPDLGKLQLIVLGQFSADGAESKQVVRQILKEHEVRLYTAQELDELIDEIRLTGQDLVEEPPEGDANAPALGGALRPRQP
jgi:hypothetical protein